MARTKQSVFAYFRHTISLCKIHLIKKNENTGIFKLSESCEKPTFTHKQNRVNKIRCEYWDDWNEPFDWMRYFLWYFSLASTCDWLNVLTIAVIPMICPFTCFKCLIIDSYDSYKWFFYFGVLLDFVFCSLLKMLNIDAWIYTFGQLLTAIEIKRSDQSNKI